MSEQVRRIAKGLLCDLADHWDDRKFHGLPFWSDDETADILGRAILAERQRCALIAKSGSGWIGKFHRGEGLQSDLIAAAILDPQTSVTALSQDTHSLPTPAATPTDSANPPPVESVGPNSDEVIS